MTKGYSRTSGHERLRKEQALRGQNYAQARAYHGCFASGVVAAAAPLAVVVVETRQQRRYRDRMALKGGAV